MENQPNLYKNDFLNETHAVYGKDDSVEIEQDAISTFMEKPFNPKEIDIVTQQLSLDNIIKRLKEEEIDLLPDFQRMMDLWDPIKQSRLIESILINFPLPAFYFDGSNPDKWLVVDGLQRLSSIQNFVIKKTLKLQGLEFLTFLEGHNFEQLPRALQRQIEEAQIIAYIIKPGTPAEVKFNIFKRINTGGLILTPQEIRNALNQGFPAHLIAEMAEFTEFKEATQNRIPKKRMLDREFITRFVAFYLYTTEEYKPDLDTFLSKAMGELNNKNADYIDTMKADFKNAMKLAMKIFKKFPFRKVFSRAEKRNPINKALFEVWSVSLAKLSEDERNLAHKKAKDIFIAFKNLMDSDKKFEQSITEATGDKTRVIYRFSEIKKLINICIYND